MIYTFYSYKGGVGRSMAVANIAECFYLQGLRVVIIDWDLEAPGLESFFEERRAGDDAAPHRPGLIDMLVEYKRAFAAIDAMHGLSSEPNVPEAFRAELGESIPSGSDSFEGALDARLSPVAEHLHALHGEVGANTPSLALLSAGLGHRDNFRAYARAVQAFDWEEFFASYRGKEYFDWLRDELLKLADVVLIDSRTGVTEMGGVCARQMADVVVSFAAPNNQNISGVAQMMQSFRREETKAARGGNVPETLIVPTRVDPTELDDLARFEARFREVAEDGDNTPQALRELELDSWRLQIPYRAKYAYQERRVIGPDVKSLDPTRGLETAYWNLADHLALLAKEGHLVRQAFAQRLQRAFPRLARVVLSYMPDALEAADEVRKGLADASIALGPDLRHDDPNEEPSASRITQASRLVVVLSAQALDDAGPVRRELRLARQLGTAAVAVATTGGATTLPFWLQGIEVHGAAGKSLIASLGERLPRLCAPVLVPDPPPGMVERPALQAALKSALLAAAAAPGRSTVAVCGPGGSGKTSLLALLCRDETLVDSYPAGIFHVGADDAAAPARIAAAIAGEAVPAEAAEPTARVRELLRGRRALLIVDDLWNESRFAELAAMLDAGTVVAVTRDPKLARSVATEVCEIGEMDDEEAARLFTGPPELTERLGRLPLVLSLANAWMQQRLRAGDEAGALQQLEQRIERDGALAFDRLDTGRDAVPGSETTASAQRESTAAADLSAGGRSGSVARSIEFTLAQLQSWQRRRFEQLATLCTDGATTLDAARTLWRATPPEIGEPRWLDDEAATEDYWERLADLGLLQWDRVQHSLSLPGAVRDYLRAQGVIGRHAAGARRQRSGQDRRDNPDLALAARVLAGEALAYRDLHALARRLKAAGYFSQAHSMFALARRLPEASADAVLLAQQQALCTYKDLDLPSEHRTRRALEVLGEVQDLATTTDPETLGLAGAVHKQRWVADGQRASLERSLAYYLRGYAQGAERDYGYTGINAAFVLDLIAQQEEAQAREAGTEAGTAAQRRAQAREIREHIVDSLAALPEQPELASLGQQWWFIVTVAEALFGLQRHEQARQWLRNALSLDFDDWAFQATAQQLVRLALAQNDGRTPEADSPAWRTLRVFLGEDLVALRSAAIGKVGLALSGGGFRASLFHIGVLARLAELDMLRHVEVLSCVSGGSIIGTHYYLEVKRLLEHKRDADIVREDYVELVKRIEVDFLAGVQTNPRTRLFANPWPNLKSLFKAAYSRTDRLGELFEKDFFARAGARGPIYMDELLVSPLGAAEAFVPKVENWRRAAKVPILVLNATSLNTGHNWQFTATWMGEPPSSVGAEIDGNDLLRRMYYWQAPPPHRRVRLGRAVAASACVPGLFDPVEFRGLYPGRSVRLVDGGVHDNQGVAGLLEQECSVLLVSDASGQMASLDDPAAGPLKVPVRASSIQGARVREAQLVDLKSRRRASLIRSLMFVHLKKDLEVELVGWVGCTDPVAPPDEGARRPLTGYGVLKTVQRRLAAVRTDLDSFNDAEAHALMLSGYRMASLEFAAALREMPAAQATESDWGFKSVARSMDRAHDFELNHAWLMKLLGAAESRFMKVWKLSPALRWVPGFALALLLAFGARLWPGIEAARELAAGAALLLAAGLAVLVGVPFLLWLGYRLFNVEKPFAQLLTGFAFAAGAWVGPRLQLWVFDPGYLALGRLRPEPVRGSGRAGGVAWPRPLLLVAVILLLPVALYFWTVGQAVSSQQRADYPDARAKWSSVLALKPSADAWLARGKVNAELGSYADALADFDRALAAGAESLAVHRERARANLKAGNDAAAVADIDRVLASSSDDALKQERAAALARITLANSKSLLDGLPFEVFDCPKLDPRAAALATQTVAALKGLGATKVTHLSLMEKDLRDFKPLMPPYQLRYRTTQDRQAAAVKFLLDDPGFGKLAGWQRVEVPPDGRDVVRLLVCDASAGKKK